MSVRPLFHAIIICKAPRFAIHLNIFARVYLMSSPLHPRDKRIDDGGESLRFFLCVSVRQEGQHQHEPLVRRELYFPLHRPTSPLRPLVQGGSNARYPFKKRTPRPVECAVTHTDNFYAPRPTISCEPGLGVRCQPIKADRPGPAPCSYTSLRYETRWNSGTNNPERTHKTSLRTGGAERHHFFFLPCLACGYGGSGTLCRILIIFCKLSIRSAFVLTLGGKKITGVSTTKSASLGLPKVVAHPLGILACTVPSFA